MGRTIFAMTDHVQDSLMKVKRVKNDKSLDVCSLEGHEGKSQEHRRRLAGDQT